MSFPSSHDFITGFDCIYSSFLAFWAIFCSLVGFTQICLKNHFVLQILESLLFISNSF